MSQKRKATQIGLTPREADEDFKNGTSTKSPAPKLTAGSSKRIKTSSKYQEAPESTEEVSREGDDKQKNIATTENVATTTTTDTEGSKSHSSRPAIRRKYYRPELKADLAKSRDKERTRADATEAKNERLKIKNYELQSRLEQQNGRVASLEISQLAGGGRCGNYFQDDETIQENVNLLFESVGDWALDWAHGPGDHLMLHTTEAGVLTTINFLQGHTEHLKSRVLREEADQKCTWATAGCRLATEAFLANKIARSILSRPFNIPTQKSTGSQASMERYVDRVRDGMKKSQIEAHLWTSMTLRAYYSQDQYADNIFEPMTNDHLQEARLEMYHSEITKWMLQADSPLKPLLRPCQGDEFAERTTALVHVLHAASKLSLQLWVQNSKVEVVDFMLVGEQMLHRYDPRRASLHSLMPPFPETTRLHDKEIDLLVWPCVKVTKFDSVSLGKAHAVSTKASVVIYRASLCRANKIEFYKNMEAAASQDPARPAPQQREQEEAKSVVDEQNVGPPQDYSRGNPGTASEDSYQPHEVSAGTAAETTQKDLDVDVLMAESDEATAKQPNAKGSPTTRSRDPPRTVIDLTDESETQQSAEKCQESQKSTSQEGPQNEKPSTTVPNIESLLPGLTQAASMSAESETPRPEEYQTQTQSSQAPTAEQRERSVHQDSQAERHAEEQLNSAEASREASVGPQEYQAQKDQTELANMYRFIDVDPAIEEFDEPLSLQGLGNDAEGSRVIGRRESLTRNMTRGRSDDGGTPDALEPESAVDQDDDTMAQKKQDVGIILEVVDSTITTDQGEDTIVVVVLPEPATLTENSQDQANNDLKASAQDTMDVDKETETKDVDMNEGADGDGEPVEPAVDKVSGEDGQDGTSKATESTAEDMVQTTQ